ncbi:response regulator transcription factor [Photobacterium sanguinicancri]|uniref:DNA-binding response regulator n=1 Tax=Photobacterium sanguinicancri TaxID=875932 RepID=A0ABX4FU98_9GAMM|nr:response regulator transcription factor [Photobacterium sanguinicancri]OZS42448.1 DNA-binding response regulator [Photobacterium sanguinicancri]
MKILLVEDHLDIAGIIFDYFEIKGFTLDHASNGEHGLALAQANYYDLIILDIMLPKMNGMDICHQLRTEGNDTPILMLTALDTREDTLTGFAKGADDYLVKPFDLEILEARIIALTRRRQGEVSTNVLIFADLSLNLQTHSAQREDKNIALNPSQFIILQLLMQRAPQHVSKQALSHALWKDDEPEGNILRSHIYQLRNLIDKPFASSYIHTVPKFGYQLRDEACSEKH